MIMDTLSRSNYPQPATPELLSMIEALGILRMLVINETEAMSDSCFGQQVTDQLVRLRGIQYCCIFLPIDGELSFLAGSRSSLGEVRPLNDCLTDKHEQLARKVLENDSLSGLGVCREDHGGRRFFAVALYHNREKLGSIVLAGPGDNYSTPWNDQLLKLCADIVSQALVSRRLIDAHNAQQAATLRKSVMGEPMSGKFQYRPSAEAMSHRRTIAPGDLEYLDYSTGLPNGSAFNERLRIAVQRARSMGELSSMLLLDIDHFRMVNEVAGHSSGDRLIEAIAFALIEQLPPHSFCARLGSDEFGILLQGLSHEEAMAWAHRMQAEVNALTFDSEGERFSITTSIGVVHLHRNGPDAEELMRQAHSACQCAQERKFGIRQFNANDALVQRRHQQSHILKRVIRAIEDDSIELFCQPIMQLGGEGGETPQSYSGEILVRMRDEGGELISAGEMLTQAERYGFSTKLDQRVLARTLDYLGSQKPGVECLDQLAINLSAHSIGNRDFLEFLVDEVGKSGVDPKKLCFEITETAAILDVKTASKLIAVVKKLGCTFALDDFGSGYASYLYLRDLDVDYLKIDGEFVRSMATDPVNRAMVQTMLDMGKLLNKKVVAEFVENRATLNLLKEMGVDFVQGYFIGRPGPLDEFVGSMDEVQRRCR